MSTLAGPARTLMMNPCIIDPGHRPLPQNEPSPSVRERHGHLSPRTAERNFAHAGRRFTDAVVAARLSYAKERLGSHPPARISDIAYDSGFNDLSQFNRCFEGAFGRSPSGWRGQTLLEAFPTSR